MAPIDRARWPVTWAEVERAWFDPITRVRITLVLLGIYDDETRKARELVRRWGWNA